MSDNDPEWGKMSRGQPYVNLATDVLRAYFAALGGLEGAILAYVIEKTWGESSRRGRKGRLWPQSEPCKIDAKKLMAALGIGASGSTNFYRAVRNLVKSGMIFEVDGGYMPNKNAHQWTIPDTKQPKLKPDFRSFALASQKVSVIKVDHTDKGSFVIKVDHKPEEKVIKIDHSESPGVIKVDHKKVASVINFDHKPHSIERTAANPTGLIQIPSASAEGDAPHPPVLLSRKKRKRKRERIATLPLKDQPIHILPISLEPGEILLHAHVLSLTRTRKLPDGNRDIADHVVREFRDWVARGFGVAFVKKAINDTINAIGARDPDRFTSYLLATIKGRAAKAKAKPDAPPISQRLAETSPNVGGNESYLADRKSQDEASEAILRDWSKLTDSARAAIEAEWDLANPRPPDIPSKLWPLMRKRGCVELFASHSLKVLDSTRAGESS